MTKSKPNHINEKSGRSGRDNPRRLAAESLIKWERYDKYAGLETASVLGKAELCPEDRRLYSALVYGVVERLLTLDYIIDIYSAKPVGELDPEVRAALRLGIYQLLYLDRIPCHAAVFESASLVPKRAAGYVNGVLRSFIRGNMKYTLPDKETQLLAYLSVKYSVPSELCGFLLRTYGAEDAEGILSCSFGGDRLCLRVNTLKCSVFDASERLAEMGVSARISRIASDVLVIPSGAQFLSGIEEGLWFVQDEASAAAVETLAPEPGALVADMCAAPGGKSFGCAIMMENCGRVLSFDIHENKLSLVRAGAERLGISVIETGKGDARTPPEELSGRADFVLCDAPCSGLGVMSKKPDIRYKPLSDIERLPQIQYEILCGASKCVRPGGVLMYSTCTLNPEENERVFQRFASENTEFVPAPFNLAGYGEDGSALLMPHKTGTDGFFISRFIRKA